MAFKLSRRFSCKRFNLIQKIKTTKINYVLVLTTGQVLFINKYDIDERCTRNKSIMCTECDNVRVETHKNR